MVLWNLVVHAVYAVFQYIGLSLGEWFIHRHGMHEPFYKFLGSHGIKYKFPPLLQDLFTQISGRHVTHHQLTDNADMTITDYFLNPKDGAARGPNEYNTKQASKKSAKGKGGQSKAKKSKKNAFRLTHTYASENVMEGFQNLYFLWPTTVLIFGANLLIGATLNVLIFGCHWRFIVLVCVVLVVYHASVWNCMHPMMHEYSRRLRWYEGIDIIDREWFAKTALYKFLWKNHVLHHIVTGKHQCNFNIALPFADMLLGTRRAHYNSKYRIDTDAFEITKI